MNILYLINHAGQGGTEKYIKILAQDMINRKNKCFLVYNEPGRLVDNMKSLGIETIRLNMKSPFDFKAAKILRKLSKERNIDIIHTQFARENYIAILSNSAKVVHTSHIILKNNFIWKALNFVFMRRNKKIIALCDYSKKLLIDNKYPKSKITVIPNGVSYKEDVALSLGNTPFTFVTLTRFSEEKGIFFLLESIKELKSRQVHFKVIFAGDGELLPKAKEYAIENSITENVVFTGFVTEPEELLKNANCFINASKSEVISFAILEAMSMGLAVIATNVGGNPDIVNYKTNCGLLVNYNDVNAMADSMEKMITDKGFLKACSSNSLKAIKNTFNIENILKMIYSVYKEEKHDFR